MVVERDFSEFAGIWTDEEAAAFDSATARHVDPGDWAISRKSVIRLASRNDE
jgi:hypothetical protein